MNCPICRKGETFPGTTTVTLERDGLILVGKSVPAQVCDNCGEAYVDESSTANLLAEAKSEARAGFKISVQHFQAAKSCKVTEEIILFGPETLRKCAYIKLPA